MNKLILTPSGFKTYKLIESFTQIINKKRITVPKGYKTDLASVPRLLWVIIPPFGRYSQAAVIHDYLYANSGYSKKECDLIFYKLMIKYGTYKWKAKLMYLAVSLFGKKNG